MPWEFEEEAVKARRDWSKLMWYGVAVLMIIGVIALLLPRNEESSSTRARVSHILIKVDAKDKDSLVAGFRKISEIRKEIMDGTSFPEAAAKYSQDATSASRGGDIGWVHKGELAEAIDQYTWIAPLNEVSGIIQTDYGFHLVIVYDRKVSKAEMYELELKQRVLNQGGSPQAAPKP